MRVNISSGKKLSMQAFTAGQVQIATLDGAAIDSVDIETSTHAKIFLNGSHWIVDKVSINNGTPCKSTIRTQDRNVAFAKFRSACRTLHLKLTDSGLIKL